VKLKTKAPVFDEELVEDGLKDGYWLQAVDVDGDGRPDLVASGLAEGEVVWYQNPGWKKRRIGKFDKPVALDGGDIAGDGRMDLVICHDYGECMFNCRPQDGKISWLRNPGEDDAGEWEVRHVGDLVAAHRLRLGRFTGAGPELLALPVVGPGGGVEAVHQPIHVTLFRQPADVLGADRWDSQLADDRTFRVIHGVALERDDRDWLLLASEEGLTWFGYPDGGWQSTNLGAGEPDVPERKGFKGSGNLALGRIGSDPYAYIATVEPFHGNTVAVYTRESGSGVRDGRWKRTVLDVFGDSNQRGEGPAHHVVTGDFDGDGDDEFLVALRGPMPWQGVFYYKAVDVEKGAFVKNRVSSASAARIAVADFDGDGILDFATTGYYTPGYFLCEQPRVLTFHNRFGAPPAYKQLPIPAGPLGG
jgi:hypothetical protein